MEKQHFRVVMLILSAHNSNLTKKNRIVWKKYMNSNKDIKVFFNYGNSTDFKPEDSDLIFSNIEETYDNMLLKTVEALKVIDAKYTYDFFIRTNLGTFWNFEILLENLNYLPIQLCYSGDGGNQGGFNGMYLSGTDTIVNGYMINEFLKYESKLNHKVAEDCGMGMIFHGEMKAPFIQSKIFFMENYDLSTTKEEIINDIEDAIENKCDHFRVKNYRKGPREILDMRCYNVLLEKIYGLRI